MAIKIEITLTPEQISEAIGNFLKTQGFEVTDSVYFRVQTVSTGYGYSERDDHVFGGATVNVKPIDSSKSFNSLASQIASVEADGRQYGDH